MESGTVGTTTETTDGSGKAVEPELLEVLVVGDGPNAEAETVVTGLSLESNETPEPNVRKYASSPSNAPLVMP